MEEKTLQPSAGEENKPQNKKTIKLKEKNNIVIKIRNFLKVKM